MVVASCQLYFYIVYGNHCFVIKLDTSIQNEDYDIWEVVVACCGRMGAIKK